MSGFSEGARRAEQSYWRPYTVTTGTGTSGYQAGHFTAALSPELAALQGSAFGTAGQFLPELAALCSAVSPNLSWSQSPCQVQAEQLAMRAPSAVFIDSRHCESSTRESLSEPSASAATRVCTTSGYCSYSKDCLDQDV
jgi:hypothetical protein